MSKLEQQLAQQIRLLKLPEPQTEYRFAAHYVGLQAGIKQRLADAGLKNWRFDFAWPDHMLAVEVEGGSFMRGGSRHTRGVGFREDMHKYHHAMRLGWTVYRCEESLIRTGQAVDLISKLLKIGDYHAQRTEIRSNERDSHVDISHCTGSYSV